MGHRRDTQAASGDHFTATKRSRIRASKTRQYHDSYNPVSGLEPEYETGHDHSRKHNTMNSRKWGGGSMADTTFRREGLAAL